MKRFILLLVVLAGGLVWAAFSIPTNAATVNGTTISQQQLNADISAIAGSRDYQCFLNAEEYLGSNGEGILPPVEGAGQNPGSGAQPTATTAFVSEYLGTDIGHQIIFNQAAKRHIHATESDISAATAGLRSEITSTMKSVEQVQSDSVTCGPAPTLTGQEVLATLPASFVHELGQFDATVAELENSLSGADTPANLTRYFDAHRSAFDTACFTVAQYSSQSDAETALKTVAAGTPFSQVSTQATGGGPQGCDILYGIASQLPSTANLDSLKTGQVSSPIAVSSSDYLLIQITSRTPTSFAKAETAVRSALSQVGANDTRALLDSVEQHSAISVNSRYGTWTPTSAQIVVPNPPPATDVLNTTVNEPVVASSAATASGSAAPAAG